MLYLQNTVWVHFPKSIPVLGKTKVTSQSLGGIPASHLSRVRFIFHIPTAFKSGPNQATSVPITLPEPPVSLKSEKEMGKDFSFPMTGDSSTWLCLCSLTPVPHGRVFILWSPRTYCWDSKEEIPFLPFFPSLLSYHQPTPSTKSPQQILQHNFPGHHESLLIVSFWELTALLHLPHLSCFSHGSVTEHKAQE